jgi:hypothetical protein
MVAKYINGVKDFICKQKGVYYENTNNNNNNDKASFLNKNIQILNLKRGLIK